MIAFISTYAIPLALAVLIIAVVYRVASHQDRQGRIGATAQIAKPAPLIHRYPWAALTTIWIILIGAAVAIYHWSTSLNLGTDTLPGFSATAGMEVSDLAVARRQYIFQYSTPEGAQTSLYLSQNDTFIFSVRDINGEEHSLELPIGRYGIPLGVLVFVSCEIGISSNSSYLRILRDGKEIANKIIPFRLNLGSRNWVHRGTFGADNNGQNGSGYTVAILAVWHLTLNDHQYSSLVRRSCQYLKDVKSPLIAIHPLSFIDMVISLFTDLPSAPCHGQ